MEPARWPSPPVDAQVDDATWDEEDGPPTIKSDFVRRDVEATLGAEPDTPRLFVLNEAAASKILGSNTCAEVAIATRRPFPPSHEETIGTIRDLYLEGETDVALALASKLIEELDLATSDTYDDDDEPTVRRAL